MKQPLALPGRGFHFARVRRLCVILLATLLATPALAQDAPVLPPPDAPAPPIEMPPLDVEPGEEDESVEAPPLPPGDAEEAVEAPDYSRLSSDQERAARLDEMFARLKLAEDETSAGLIAEEIWAQWTRSGSATVDFTLRRAAAAQARGRMDQSRALFDTVTQLEPDFAEGWARSGRLAFDERDFSRAVGDSLRALQREPRHFYALWTLASVLERLGKTEQALEAYREALAIHPQLDGVADRVKALEGEVEGSVL